MNGQRNSADDPRILLTCSGVSNVGQLTTQAALVLQRNRPGEWEWVTIKNPLAVIRETAGTGENLTVIEGCSDGCAIKKLESLGITPARRITVTGLGIEKKYGRPSTWDDIAKITGAILNTREDF